MADYVKLAATALRLVEKDGRDVTFVQLETQPADAAKPWRGAADPREAADTNPTYDEVTTRAVAVPPSSASSLGLRTELNELVKRSEQILIVAQPTTGEKLEEFDEIEDDDSRWKILFTEVLQPATVRLCYFVGVMR